MPESFLSAAKKLASAADLPWPEVQKFYRALQQPEPGAKAGAAGYIPPHEWSDAVGLPKSAGRAVWAAHPNFMVRLMIAVAVAGDPAQSRRAVEEFIFGTARFREFDGSLEEFLARALVDVEASREIKLVEFATGSGRAIVTLHSGDVLLFEMTPFEKDGSIISKSVYRGSRLIGSNPFIKGEMFAKLCDTVEWRRNEWPLIAEAGSSDE